MQITKDQVTAYIQTVRAIADAIKEMGSVPAGTIYATVMSVMGLPAFERIIGTLTSAKLVKRDPSGMLHWIGPK